MPPDESASKQLPPNPSLNLLSNLAKQFRKQHRSGDPSVYERIRDHHPYYASASNEVLQGATLSLRDAQLVIAREHGFENWVGLKQHVLSAKDEHRTSDVDPEQPGDVTRVVPFFAVSDMDTALAHYVDQLGFEMKKQWIDDGQLAWY